MLCNVISFFFFFVLLFVCMCWFLSFNFIFFFSSCFQIFRVYVGVCICVLCVLCDLKSSHFSFFHSDCNHDLSDLIFHRYSISDHQGSCVWCDHFCYKYNIAFHLILVLHDHLVVAIKMISLVYTFNLFSFYFFIFYVR